MSLRANQWNIKGPEHHRSDPFHMRSSNHQTGFIRVALGGEEVPAHPDHIMPLAHLVARTGETAQLLKAELPVQVHAALVGQGDAGIRIQVALLLHRGENFLHQLAADRT